MKSHAVYTRGPIGRTMLRTGFAMLAGTLAMSGYNIVDTYFVGQLGRTPLAAMGFTFPVIMLAGCLFHGLAAGVMTPSAQALGRGRKPKASTLVSSGVLLIVLVSALLAVLGMAGGGVIFRGLGASGETLVQVHGYMDIWFLGCVTASLSMAGNNLLIAAGDSRGASAMMVLGLTVNSLLDPVMIFGWLGCPAMGIRGAALATVISQLIAALAVLVMLSRKHRLLRFGWIPWRQLKEAWGVIVRFAIPAVIGMLMMPVGSTVITWITARFGDTAVAAAAAAGRLEMVAFVFPMALGISLLPMIGQNYGARLYSRIRDCRRFAMRFALGFLLVMAVIYYCFAELLVRQFSPDPEVQKVMALAMRIIPWGFGMIEVHRFAGFFYTGCGRPAVSAWLNALRILGLMVPFSLLALWAESLPGLFFARLAADVAAGTVGLILARRMVARLPEDGEPPPVRPAFSLRSRFFPNRLGSVAVAGSDVDGRNGAL